MKNLRTYLLAGAMLIACSASAQFVNSGSTSSTSTSSPLRNDLTGWDRITVSYAPLKIISDVKGTDNFTLNGFSIGYAKGINIAPRLPFFIETGLNVQYASKSLDTEDQIDILGFYRVVPYNGGYEVPLKITYSTLNVKVPVNLAYKLSFNKVSLTPYVGINFKVNAIGKIKFEVEDIDDLPDGVSEEDVWDYNEELNNGEDITKLNLLDKKDVEARKGYDNDDVWKRFQMGYQLGVGLDYNRLHVGLGYTKDFIELCKKVKTSSVLVTLGYNF